MSTKLQQHFVASRDVDFTVSQEGFAGDAVQWVKNLFAYSPPDVHKWIGKALTAGGGDIENVNKFRKLLVKCFTDPRWINQQSFHKDEISALYFGKRLTFGKIAPTFESVQHGVDQTIKEITDLTAAARIHSDAIQALYTKTLRDLGPALRSAQSAYEQRIKRMRAGDASATSGSFFDLIFGSVLPALMLDKRLKQLADEIHAVHDRLGSKRYWGKVGAFELFGGRIEKSANGERVLTNAVTEGPVRLPALNGEQVQYLGKTLLDWVDRGYLFDPQSVVAAGVFGNNKWFNDWSLLDQSDFDFEDFDTTKNTFADNRSAPSEEEIFWYLAKQSSYAEELERLFSTKVFLKKWAGRTALFSSLSEAAVGLVYWMAGSTVNTR